MSEMVTPTSDQLTLLPEEPPAFTLERVQLDTLPSDEDLVGPPPDASLVASIRRLGVLQPVLLMRSPEDVLTVVEGKRRVKASRAAGRVDIPAWVAAMDEMTPHALTLIAHATRRANPAADLDAIERLLAMGASERDIARETGLRIPTLRQRLRLLDLDPALREGLRRGVVSATVAEQAAKLPVSVQERLAAKLDSEGTLTAEDVDSQRRVRAVTATAAFPFALVASTPGANDVGSCVPDAWGTSDGAQDRTRAHSCDPAALLAMIARNLRIVLPSSVLLVPDGPDRLVVRASDHALSVTVAVLVEPPAPAA